MPVAAAPLSWPSSEPAKPDLELVEMANLPKSDTGIDGTIYISTAQGSHGARVKWYPGRAGREQPCLAVTIAAEPRIINHDLPDRVATVSGTAVREWVIFNQAKLQTFWDVGETWTRSEISSFIDSLEKYREG